MSPAVGALLALGCALAVTALPSVWLPRIAVLAGSGRLARSGAVGPATVGGPARAVRWSGAVGGAGAAVGLGAVALRGAVLLAVAGAAVSGVAALLARDAVRGRELGRRHRQLLTAVRVLAGELAAGATPAAALHAAAATGDVAAAQLHAGVDALRDGADAAAALAASGEPGVRALGAAWRLVESTGAALAEVVDHVAADLAAQDVRRRAVAVALAGPRAAAVLVAALPSVGVAMGAAMDARPLEFLLGPSAGQAVCCLGVLLDAAGVLWLRRIVRRAGR
ncbi:type II secretion system protein F (GspF) [Jatrophihabitans endophyticus]|uniref:Type II secretion system protein F (GspF) n=1 Tax=Jatrophihabitans endophyticus TaxID=1206085 RepID=A0A1M5H212_9ACTN|nr:type II secretion system F family protein [Jatrophihabitans endophyticus]SHG09958.1 type II secretion system protein F (GspF) [Jatrophihabitans endophyticus]